jgi:hypothetical protein
MIAPRTMKPCLSFMFALALALLTSCASHPDKTTPTDLLKGRELISYFDRNRDGQVDLEKHHYRNTADADWELQDNDYNGRYEKKILYGFAVITTAVNLPVPTNVKIQKSP